MKQKLIIFAVIAVMCLRLTPVLADGDELVISQIQVGTSENASDEFITIYNNSTSLLDIGGIKIEYKSATGASWSTRATIAEGTQLESYHQYLVASIRPADTKLSPGLAQTGGNIRIMNSANDVLDAIAWGNGDSPQIAALTAPPSDSIILRKPVVGSLALQNTHNNSEDFMFDGIDIDEEPQPDDGSTTPVTTFNPPALSLQLTEIFPDPISPQTDSADEFIELYNPNSSAVNLYGWQLRDAGGKVFTFTNQSIDAHTYQTFYSRETHLSLNNSGDTITLIDPSGAEIDQTMDFETARAGLSWGLTDNGWGWTTSPTPNAKNSAQLVIAAEQKTSKSKAKTTKPKSTKAKKSTLSKLASKLNPLDPNNTEDETQSKPVYTIWSWLLIAAGVGTIGYGIYEYRPEIKAAYLRLRAKFRSSG